jgi:hypothetical protein
MTSFSTLHLPKTIQTIRSKIALPGSLMNVLNVQVIAHRVLCEWDSTLRAARRHACTHIAITQSNHPTHDYSTCERGEWQKGSSIGRWWGAVELWNDCWERKACLFVPSFRLLVNVTRYTSRSPTFWARFYQECHAAGVTLALGILWAYGGS